MLIQALIAAITAIAPVGEPPVLEVPFVAQQKDTCGAAALAMVLGYYGAPVPQDAIAGALLEDELHGIRGSRLADFARGRGMVALAFAGDLALAREHVARGRPLILALAAGRRRYHDVVLIGFDDARREAILNDPAAGAARRVSERELDERWLATGRWTLLVQPSETSVAAPAIPAAGDTTLPAMTPPAAPDPAGAPTAAADAALSGSAATNGYEGLVQRAVALGREGKSAEAGALLERALALEPARPEAWVERGGLHFLAGRYGPAIADLRRALSIRDEAYARELVAASLQMLGRESEALAEWNRLGQPTLASVEIGGLKITRDEVARREVGLAPGELLTAARLQGVRRRLEATGAFERVTLRTRPRGDGSAGLDVAVAERHGFARGPADFLLTTGVNLAWQRLRLRYSNLGGTGVALGGSLRWQENRPETTLQLQWPRPFGIAAYGRLTGFRGEQAYELGAPFAMRRRGVDAGLRHVLDGGWTVSAGLRVRQRDFSRPYPDARPGLVSGLDAGLEGRLFETARQRLDATLHVFAAGPVLASELAYAQADGELRYEGVVSAPEGRSVERSVVALRLRGGWGSAGLPVDEMYAPGISPESDLPLRAHPLTRGGAIGANPVGRSVLLANAEWRQRLLHRAGFDLGVVGFTDLATVGRVATGSRPGVLVDAGIGVRIAILTGPVIRVDHAWGLSDGRRALFVGLSQAF